MVWVHGRQPLCTPGRDGDMAAVAFIWGSMRKLRGPRTQGRYPAPSGIPPALSRRRPIRRQSMSLKGKTLFITGASRGIGLAIALRAARDGANIAIAAKTAEPHPKLEGTIHTAAKEIEAAGGKALPLMCDIRSEGQGRGGGGLK